MTTPKSNKALKVFISWSGEASGRVAKMLHDCLSFVIDKDIVKPWTSTHSIEPGARWWEEIDKGLAAANFGIVCVTPGNLSSPWLMAEAGALAFAYRKNGVCPYLLAVAPEALRATPLAALNGVNADKAGTRRLLKTLTEAAGRQADWAVYEKRFEAHWQAMDKELEAIATDNGDFALMQAQVELNDRLRKVEPLTQVRQNRYFRQLIVDELTLLSHRLRKLEKTGNTFQLPYIVYPYALTSLMHSSKAHVKAIAIIDKDERFWRSQTADDVLINTPPECSRVFVFRDAEHMKENMPVLRKHALRYSVSALAYKNLAAEFPSFSDDYSVVGDIHRQVLARYDESTKPKSIAFTTDSELISRYEDELRKIISASVAVPQGEIDESEFIARVFEPLSLTLTDRRRIEMSAYIKIHDYDKHEEEHAYYVEMMDRMIEICRKRRAAGPIRVLELGAGTGIFTKRLIENVRDAEIVAVEIDWACYKALEFRADSLRPAASGDGVTIDVRNEDSRTYDPAGKFDFVVSSFADHHIKPSDKRKYFANVRKNLQPHGMFIVGDEFLPEHDPQDVDARKRALHAYHDHIIDIARTAGHAELVELEQAALDSGLSQMGDFKLSCPEYEKVIESAGFRWQKEKIGPLDRDDIGGVYVYRLTA